MLPRTNSPGKPAHPGNAPARLGCCRAARIKDSDCEPTATLERQVRILLGRILRGREPFGPLAAGLPARAALVPAAFPGPEARFLGADEAGGGNQEATQEIGGTGVSPVIFG